MSDITGLILAGGLGRRMGNVDKGLVPFKGKPMVAAVIERLQPQVSELLINANRNLEQYQSFGLRVVPDDITGFAGPLAGLERGLAEAQHEYIVTAPCDSPLLPADLVARLAAALGENQAQLAVVKTLAQVHPVFCLTQRALHGHLVAYLRSGGRKIDAWYATLKVVEVNFDDEVDAFSNINTRDELKLLQQE
ncbi:MAG: molybdenum cofactor guanylyltransferase MobA [Burkholderiales bacterium]